MTTPTPTTLVITGMGRSGTSMTAAFMQALGVDVGDSLLEATGDNPRGYFEDKDFVAFHRGLFQAACPAGVPGWPDIGWTEAETLDADALAQGVKAAEALIASRRHLPLWGWKDPRTSMVLDFWHARLPEARYLLVYRRPWEVVESFFRTEQGPLAERPDYALRIWMAYNRRLLAFYRQHPGVCALVSSQALVARPAAFADVLRTKLGLRVDVAAADARLADVYDPALMTEMPLDHPAIAVMRAAHPEALALLAELDAEADLPDVRELPAAPAAWQVAVASLHRCAALAERDRSPSAVERDRLREELEASLAHERQMVAHERQVVALMRRSTSWRLTAPVRWLKTTLTGRTDG